MFALRSLEMRQFGYPVERTVALCGGRAAMAKPRNTFQQSVKKNFSGLSKRPAGLLVTAYQVFSIFVNLTASSNGKSPRTNDASPSAPAKPAGEG